MPTREPARTPREVLAYLREREVKAVDLRFMDFPGLWKHFTIPASVMTEDVFEDGYGFDGSSLRGWMPINESDMLLVPQPDTLFIDPFCRDVTLAMICNILDPDVFVLGGGMSQVSELYERLPAAIAPFVFSDGWNGVVTPARWGDASGVRGAARLWRGGEG